MLTASNFKGTSDFLPTTVKNAINQPPICEVVKITGKAQVIRYVEFELIRMTQLVSVGNNLNNAQVEFIATQLVETFPNESLADFKICFQRGCMGQYGDIFRMDGIVLRKWMEKYLDEKYELIDAEWAKTKSGEYHQQITESEVGPGRRLFDEYANSLTMGTKIPDMPEDEIERTGQREPPKRKAISYHSSPPEVGDLLDKKTQYGRECTDKLTGKPLPGMPDFKTWLELQK